MTNPPSRKASVTASRLEVAQSQARLAGRYTILATIVGAIVAAAGALTIALNIGPATNHPPPNSGHTGTPQTVIVTVTAHAAKPVPTVTVTAPRPGPTITVLAQPSDGSPSVQSWLNSAGGFLLGVGTLWLGCVGWITRKRKPAEEAPPTSAQ